MEREFSPEAAQAGLNFDLFQRLVSALLAHGPQAKLLLENFIKALKGEGTPEQVAAVEHFVE